MRITRVEAQNLKGRSFAYDLQPQVAIVGDNFTGKTSIIDAVRLAIIGYIPELGKLPKATWQLSSGERYGYIRYREDLRQESYGWRLPRPIRVTISTCLLVLILGSCDRSMNDSWLNPPSCHKKECMEAEGYNIMGSPGK